MPDQFTEVITTGYGKRILNSIAGVIFGIILFFGSFILLYWNEGRVDLSTVAKTSVPISAETLNVDSTLAGKLVSVTGILTTKEKIGDGLFLKPAKYAAIYRTVEMYSWVEERSEKKQSNLGGSETTTTTYNYKKAWVKNPSASSSFKYPEGHANPTKKMSDVEVRAGGASIGVYKINLNTINLPSLNAVLLNKTNVALSEGAVLAGDKYVFISKNAGSVFDNPQVGDLRVSYEVFGADIQTTVFGKLGMSEISSYIGPKNTTLYHIFAGSREDGIRALHIEYLMMLWLLRLAGLLMMWFGLSSILGPLNVLLSIVPAFGSLSKFLVGLVTFVVSLVLSLATIVVSMILHNVWAVLIVAVITVVAIVLAMKFLKKKA
jgi:hypothetical protein